MRFDVKLPPSIEDTNKDKQNHDKNFIPHSQIASKLKLSLSDENHMNQCNDIILAFQQLYRKYIDASNATFMINISSRNRNMLRDLYDSKYFTRNYSNSTSKSQSMVENSVNINQSNLNSCCLLNIQFNEYLNSISNSNSNINDDKDPDDVKQLVYKWVLFQTISNMEPSVREISNLMNDSFNRFKMNQELVFALYNKASSIDLV